jgi:fermentation-respiration switch protein FrsA (DUF1100 family)
MSLLRRLLALALLTSATACPSGDITLAGALFMPDDRVRHPAVVLFHGSGPQSRDAETAYWFAQHGVAALAYDKRGVGESAGDFRTVPFMQLWKLAGPPCSCTEIATRSRP